MQNMHAGVRVYVAWGKCSLNTGFNSYDCFWRCISKKFLGGDLDRARVGLAGETVAFGVGRLIRSDAERVAIDECRPAGIGHATQLQLVIPGR